MVDVNLGQQISKEEKELARLRITLGHDYSLGVDKRELISPEGGQEEQDSSENETEDLDSHISPQRAKAHRRVARLWGKSNGILPAKDSLEGV